MRRGLTEGKLQTAQAVTQWRGMVVSEPRSSGGDESCERLDEGPGLVEIAMLG